MKIFTPFSSVFIVDFEQVNVIWEVSTNCSGYKSLVSRHNTFYLKSLKFKRALVLANNTKFHVKLEINETQKVISTIFLLSSWSTDVYMRNNWFLFTQETRVSIFLARSQIRVKHRKTVDSAFYVPLASNFMQKFNVYKYCSVMQGLPEFFLKS